MRKDKKHLNDHQLRSVVSKVADEQTFEELFNHLLYCQICKQRLIELKLLKKIIKSKENGSCEHLDEILLANYVDGKLLPLQKRDIERHLLICDDCWDEFLHLASFRETEEASLLVNPPRKIQAVAEDIVPERAAFNLGEFLIKIFSPFQSNFSPQFTLKIVGAAFLVIVVLGIFLSLIEQGLKEQIDFRSTLPGIDEKVILLTPKSGSRIYAKSIAFNWRQVTQVTQYHFILMNDVGDRIFEEFTDKTFIRINSSIMPRKKQSYFWYVQGLTKSGEKIKSDISYFVFLGQNQ